MARVTLLTGGNLQGINRDINTVRGYISLFLGTIIKCTSIQKSEPWGFESDNYFLNQIVVIETDFEPHELLFKIWDIERLFGRVRGNVTEESLKWLDRDKNGTKEYSSRSMDIDILYYDDRVVKTELLTIPHKEIKNREFVLSLIKEI